MRWTITFLAFLWINSLLAQETTQSWVEEKDSQMEEEVYLSIQVYSDAIELFWEVPSEIDLSGYELQRSIDGSDFLKIAWLKAIGDTDFGGSYLHLDSERFFQEALQYRLKVVRQNGQFVYSAAQNIDLQLTRPIITFSEEVEPRFIAVDDEGLDAEQDIEVIDGTGKTVLRLSSKADKLEMDTKHLKKGVYYIRMVLADGENRVAKIMKP